MLASHPDRRRGCLVRILLSAVAVLAAGFLSAADNPPKLLQPTSPWDLDYGKTQCTAMRDYGKADDPTTLAIKPALNGQTYELAVIRPRAGPEYPEELQGTVDFGSGPIRAWLLHYRAAHRKLALYQFRITAEEMAQGRSASTVAFQIAGGPDVSFTLEAMPALLEGLRACTADLQEYWNMDHPWAPPTSDPSKGDVRSVFTSRDYPAQALQQHQEGTAQFVLLIDDTGSVAGCDVLKPSGVPILDATGCAVIQKRAKFKPRRDSSGRPTRDTYITPPVSWRID
jgi:TonB family protein